MSISKFGTRASDDAIDFSPYVLKKDLKSIVDENKTYVNDTLKNETTFVRRDGSLSMLAGLSMNYAGICDLGYDGISKTCVLPVSVVRDIIDEKGIQPEAKVDQQHANLQTQMDNVKKMPGPQGVTGPRGDRIRGPRGEPGPRGPRGETCDRGLRGETGAIGPKGETGDRGLRGETGAIGPKGETGDRGLRGETGAIGPKGETSSSDTFSTFDFIKKNAYYYVHFHPSRFESIVERVSKNKYRCENLTLIGSPGKTINTNRIINKDDSGYFTNIDQTNYIQIVERFGNLFEENKSFATFQVLNIHSPRGLLLFLVGLVWTAMVIFLITD